ncbi:MAG: hypothetical protein Q3992_06400 [Bacteroides sp.]|nr:hypothetical protein [Bacteroides sp.]
MEELIYKKNKSLKNIFIVLAIIPVVLYILGESNVIATGFLVGHSKMYEYTFEYATITLTIIGVPLALRSFGWALNNKIKNETGEKALEMYYKWSLIRLAILFGVIYFSLICHFASLRNTGSLCMLICYTALIFCIPRREKMKQDLGVE